MGFAAKEQPVPEPPGKRGFQRRDRRLFQPFITRRATGKASQFTKIASRGDHERSVSSHLSRHHCHYGRSALRRPPTGFRQLARSVSRIAPTSLIELKKAFAAVSIVMRQNRVDRGMQFCREPDKGDNIGLSSLSGVRLAIGVPIYDLR